MKLVLRLRVSLAFRGDQSFWRLSYGLSGFPIIDSHGDIHAPTGSGLGVDVDWELINASVTQLIS